MYVTVKKIGKVPSVLEAYWEKMLLNNVFSYDVLYPMMKILSGYVVSW
jgi:hypothetical protein